MESPFNINPAEGGPHPQPPQRRAAEPPAFDPARTAKGVSNDEVLAKLAERAREIPPPRDMLRMTMAAARFTLTSLEAAREIARQVREDIDRVKNREPLRELARDDVDRDEIVDALSGG